MYPIGLLVALSAFAISVRALNQSAVNYLDAVAAFIVVGGTIAVFLILVPWDLRRDVVTTFKQLFWKRRLSYSDVLNDCLDFLRRGEAAVKNIDRTQAPQHLQLLADGVELTGLGFRPERIEVVLQERLQHHLRRRRRVANAIRGLAKYPPAFGLMGTVLGLVNVMRGVSVGIDGKQTALEMAVALVATMYGLLVANLFVNPAGEMAQRDSQEIEIFGDIAITAFGLWAEHSSLLEAQEMLNSFVPPEQRIPAESLAHEGAA